MGRRVDEATLDAAASERILVLAEIGLVGNGQLRAQRRQGALLAVLAGGR